jgi:4-hydroxy-2-oxoglutarate aldolase
MNALSGIFPAIVTPFTKDGALDIEALQANFDSWNLTRLTGYLVLGSTGEVVHLDETERFTVLEVARASIPSTMPMIVGTGQHSTKATIGFTRHAAELGATYALVVTPHYFKKEMTQSAFKSFYLSVADASTIPILLYSVPQFTGVQLAPETIAELAAHPNIAGIKDSSGDVRALIHTLSLVSEDFVVLTGSAPTLYPSLTVGTKGSILAVANFVPEICLEIFNLSAQGRSQEARLCQERLLLITESIVSRYGIGGIKYAMNCVGYRGGFVRGPLAMPDSQAEQSIRAALQQIGSLNR